MSEYLFMDSATEERGVFEAKLFMIRVNDSNDRTLLHEYIHYLQTIFTISGIAEIGEWFDVMTDFSVAKSAQDDQQFRWKATGQNAHDDQSGNPSSILA